ncbi:kinase-like domain-containing protein, partial [Cerioporus squamosus]
MFVGQDRMGQRGGPSAHMRHSDSCLSALEHLETHNIFHRDIKPDNILLSRTDPTRIVLIDFGKAYYHDPRCVDKGPKDAPHNVRYAGGSPYWCSVRAYDGLVPSSEDDLESLSFVLFFLPQGELPWMPPGSVGLPSARLRAAKEFLTSSVVEKSAPVEYAAVVEAARRSDAGRYIKSTIVTLHTEMRRLSTSLGEVEQASLDWTTMPRTDQHRLASPDLGFGFGQPRD